ncbi:tetratricopeptide repeat protein [Thalassomonas actiniarum]|uniref:Sel1 repeat family protein n=1 Tax=Thalassomonas actiniarum TaxID=485447 RepID=A0AAF0C3W2_9GAMM|nr:tetratricopeptide repeat protein [Thalassomonas actiniarum]WDD99385.1 sel1 repeat family protein [Thalassomonas actiniarum]
MNAALNANVVKSSFLNKLLPGKSANTRLRHLPLFLGITLVAGLILTAANTVFNNHLEAQQTQTYISSPKIDDLYFLDYRLLPGITPGQLRPNEKYRLAKVVDITGDVVTLLYGNFFYLRQRAMEKSIRYGHLRYPEYFETRRYDFTSSELATMKDSGAIYMVKRPVLNTLDGNLVGPSKPVYNSSAFIPGKKQNYSGMAFLKQTALETSLQSAFEQFQASAELGYAEGQVNLAQMYLNGQHVQQDFSQALFWFKRAALQSHKPGVLKYGIVCKQVPECNIVDFYDELLASGVNIKVRQVDFSLK